MKTRIAIAIDAVGISSQIHDARTFSRLREKVSGGAGRMRVPRAGLALAKESAALGQVALPARWCARRGPSFVRLRRPSVKKFGHGLGPTGMNLASIIRNWAGTAGNAAQRPDFVLNPYRLEGFPDHRNALKLSKKPMKMLKF
jgi:hypothetical protein